VVSTFLEISLLQGLQPGLGAADVITKADAEANDLRQRIVGMVQLALTVITAIVLCVGSTAPTKTPAQSVLSACGSRQDGQLVGISFP
jgi:hypothetical protein